MELFPLLIIWGFICYGVSLLASSRGRSGIGFFLLSFVFSPLLGLIVILVLKNLTEEQARESARRRDEERREVERKREHERQLESLRVLTRAQSAGTLPQNIDSTAPQSVADELIKLSSLCDKGVLSMEEFSDQKNRLLGRTTN